MSKLKNYLNELSFRGNMGAIEMITFFQKASKQDIDKMEKIVKDEDWDEYKMIIKKVLGIKLK